MNVLYLLLAFAAVASFLTGCLAGLFMARRHDAKEKKHLSEDRQELIKEAEARQRELYNMLTYDGTEQEDI